MRVVVDASDTMVALGQVAVWSFELAAWGECVQRADERQALVDFAARTHGHAVQLDVGERITGPGAVFRQDLQPATDKQIARTIEILDEQRDRRRLLLEGVQGSELDREDGAVGQPTWMSWRTPRLILRHIADTEARAYLRWCRLPQLDAVDDLWVELERSAAHVRQVITTMPRSFEAEHRGELWTPVKLLRRLAWHERVELVYLGRRLASPGSGARTRGALTGLPVLQIGQSVSTVDVRAALDDE